MAFQCLLYEKKGPICYLTLNRPDKLNALNGAILTEFREAMDVIEVDPDIRVVILTGAGRAFSAGFDLERGPDSSDPHEMQAHEWREHLNAFVDTFLKVWRLSKPVIAAVNGYALAGACELVQVCDVKIASDRAVLGEPEIRAGLGPPVIDHSLQRQPGYGQGDAPHWRHRGRPRSRPDWPGQPGRPPR